MRRLPAWYGELCERISGALHHGELGHDEAAALVERWHPVALDQLGHERRRQAAVRVTRTRIIWPPPDPALDDEQRILADLAALVAGGLAQIVTELGLNGGRAAA